MDYSLGPWNFAAKYKEDYREATGTEIEDAYNKYKEFYTIYHRDNPGATTDCYTEYLETLGKQDDTPIEKKFRIQHSKDEEEQFAQAFRVPYDDPKGKRVDRFVSFCNKCVKMWNPAKYYALYSSIVQSSGTGKSRLLAEVAKKRYVIYCCLRGPGSTGYPPSSPIRRKLITDAQATDPRKWPSERLYVSFLVAAIEVFQNTMSNNRMDCGAWFNYHTNESCSYWKEVEERMDYLSYEKRADFSEIHQKDAIARALKNVGCFDKRFITHLIFAFDEARSLLPSRSNADYFSSLRRALRCLPTYHPSQHQAFAVMLDTTSVVADFLPEMERDPSSRPLIEGLKLMPPFYLLDTIDDTITVATPPRSIEEMYCGQRLLQLGRPLFRSYIQAGDLSFFSTHLSTLKNTAAAKLVGGEFPRVVQMTDALSVLSCRVCVDIVPTNHIASQLVASYMRFCVFVSESRQYLFTIAPSEPFLVDVATDLMYQNGCLVKLIKQLSDAMRCGVVDGGSRGELVARLLLILAVDQAIKQSLWKQELSHTCPVTVELFFDHLFGTDALSKPVCSSTDQRELFKRGLIFFTHFIPVYYKPRCQHLLHALTRGAAIICERNNQGVDIIIPVLLPADVDTNYTDLHADDFTCEEDFPSNFIPEFPEDNEETSLIAAYDNHGDRSKKRRLGSETTSKNEFKNFRLHPSRVSFILIQVKNYQDSIDSFSRIARETINPTVCGIMDEPARFPYASVYMQFGSKGKRNPVIEALPLHEQQCRQDSSGMSTKVYTDDELKALNMYQIGLAAFGLDDSIYPCLRNTGHASKSLIEVLQLLLVSWPDPARMNGRKGSNENAAVRRCAIGSYATEWNDASFWDQISNEESNE